MRSASSYFIIAISSLVALATTSCGDDITNEYITQEYYNNYYVTNQYLDTLYLQKNYLKVLKEQTEVTDDVRPEALHSGDTVAIFALSNYVTESEIAAGKSLLEEWGLAVVEASNLYKQNGRYAGTIEERMAGTQALIDNPNVKAMIAARGGYGAAQVLPFLDLEPLRKNPKWIVGYSDVTAFHAALSNLGIESIHGAMAQKMSNNTSTESLHDALFGTAKELTIPYNDNCVEGEATGRLVGGNLSLIYSLGGTIFDLNTKGAILLIEDTGESNYSLDRMLTNLKLSGKLSSVKGIIIGQFINMTQGMDKSVAQIIADRLEGLDIPVMYGVNVGHDQPNLAVQLGRTVTLSVSKSGASMKYAD